MNDTTTPAAAANGELRHSLNEVIKAAEALMHATAEQTGTEYRKARSALDAKVSAAKERIAGDMREAVAGAKAIGEKGDRLVHANPWAAIGIGAGAGLLLGLLLRRH